jgi:hypothetical protein
VREEKLGSTRKSIEIYSKIVCITNLILAIYTQSVNGLEEPFKNSGEKFLQPTLSGCNGRQMLVVIFSHPENNTVWYSIPLWDFLYHPMHKNVGFFSHQPRPASHNPTQKNPC